MLFETIGQFREFVWMLAAGALIGAWYGWAALVRRLLRSGVLLGLLIDGAFGLGAGVIFCLALYRANYGHLRFYAVAAAALGFLLFAAGTFSPCRRIILDARALFRKISVKIRRFRWINVIFR